MTRLHIRIPLLLIAILFAGDLAGCSSSFSAVGQTLWSAVDPNAGLSDIRLNQRFQYLRVTVKGKVAFLALGNVVPSAQGTIHVWYSAEKEVLKFQGGRLVGSDGTITEWRHVKLVGAPSWSEVAHSEHGVEWTRVRDVMPGYYYGVRDELLVHRIGPPRSSELVGLASSRLTWFEETMKTPVPGMRLPPARYAVSFAGGKAQVIYGEQCLSTKLCFTWQRWSATKGADVIGKEVAADERGPARD